MGLACALGATGRRVLAIDLDPQFDLTRAFGAAPSTAPATVLDVMQGATDARTAALRDVEPGVDLLAGHRDMRRLELSLVDQLKREEFLARALAVAGGEWELLLIDCPPNLGLLTVNALFAAPRVLVPVAMGDGAALQSAGEVRATVTTLQSIGVRLAVHAVVRTKTDPRRLAHRAIDQALPELGLPIAHTEIPRLAAFDNAVLVGRPLTALDPDNAGATAYRRLAEELVPDTRKAVA